jgi:hypothetical protein
VTLREWFQKLEGLACSGASTQSSPASTYPGKQVNVHAESFCVKTLKSTLPTSQLTQPSAGLAGSRSRENARQTRSHDVASS